MSLNGLFDQKRHHLAKFKNTVDAVKIFKNYIMGTTQTLTSPRKSKQKRKGNTSYFVSIFLTTSVRARVQIFWFSRKFHRLSLKIWMGRFVVGITPYKSSNCTYRDSPTAFWPPVYTYKILSSKLETGIPSEVRRWHMLGSWKEYCDNVLP